MCEGQGHAAQVGRALEQKGAKGTPDLGQHPLPFRV
eukprot:gene14154-44881_t